MILSLGVFLILWQKPELLNNNQNALDTLIDVVPSLIWLAAPDGKINYVNQQWLEYTGASQSALLGNGWESFIHPADCDRVIIKWERCRDTGKPCSMDYRIRGRNDIYRWFKSSWTPVLEKDGSIKGWCGINTDIEDVKYTLETYANSTRPSRIVANTNPISIRNHDLSNIIPHITNLQQSITDTKYTLEAYASSEKRFRTIYNTVPVSIWEEDWTIVLERIATLKQSGITNFPQYFHDHPEFVLEMLRAIRILDVNECTIEMFKAQSKADLNDFFITTFSLKSINYKVFENILIALVSEQNTFHDELEIRNLAGDILHIRIALAFPSQHTNSGLIYACLVDITHQRLIEAKLKDALSFNEAILFNSPAAMAVYHKDGQCVVANDALWRLIGVTYQTNLAQNFRELDSQPEIKSLVDSCLNSLETGEPHHTELHIRIDDCEKDFWLDVQILPITLHDDPHLLVQFIDLSEIHQVTEELRTARNQAEAANRSKSEFIANMSHELRTPLNVNMGLAQLLLDTNLTHIQRDYLQKIYNSANILLGVINDILDFSKIESGHLELDLTDFFLDEVINSCIALFSTIAEEKGLQLFFNVAPDIPLAINGDRLRLNQVLNNLISNAIKFTEHGEIEVTVTWDNSPSPQLRFAVRDTGIGLNSAQVQQIFKPFTQGDTSITRKYGGTGLGLAICSSLVNLMEGKIWVESIFGQGSTFYFTLPLHPIQNEAMFRPVKQLHKMRTLVVDDHETSRRILENILQAWKMDVTVADSAECAIQELNHAAQIGRPFGLLLLDWKMPGMDGIELARYHRAGELKHNGAPLSLVIMVSAAKREQILENICDIHVDKVLEKPVTPSRLFDTLITLQNQNNILEKESPPCLPQTSWNETQPLHGARILLTEDNYTNQLVAVGILEKMGLIIDIAENGLEAVEMAQRGEYDAILMDLQMPEMDGFTATREIRRTKIGQNLPIIAMTAAVMEQDRKDAVDSGMNDYLMKPINVQELMRVLIKWIPAKKKISSQNIIATDKEKNNFSLPGLNLTDAVQQVAGDWEMLRKVLLSFLQDFSNFRELFAHADENHNPHEIAHIVHTIKGLSKNIGSSELYTLAMQFEEELAVGQQTLRVPFETALQKILNTIASLKEPQNLPIGPETTASLPEEMLKIQALLDKLSVTLEEFFVPDSELLNEIQTLLQGRIDPKLRYSLFNKIESFDFAAAQHILWEIQEIIRRN